ncbi:hypothetical protein DFH11DRAFT_1627033 [Phellopilus nigrolimitatus]|nr:hypothetical protein DFH11DRAFT_1627033 [Phellopilus nigrolimitatus]
MSLVSQKAAVSQFPTQIVTLLSRHPRAIVVASLTALLFPWTIRSFREYKALGRGGAPNFCVGWILATLAKPFGRETTSTEEYERDADKETWLKAGDGAQEVPPRGRPRPATSWHFLPHRQVDQFPGDEVKAMLVQEFRSLVDANPDLVELQLSPHEKFSDAVVIHSSLKAPHRVAEAALREIVHYHNFKDFSMHVLLSPQDCKLGRLMLCLHPAH